MYQGQSGSGMCRYAWGTVTQTRPPDPGELASGLAVVVEMLENRHDARGGERAVRERQALCGAGDECHALTHALRVREPPGRTNARHREVAPGRGDTDPRRFDHGCPRPADADVKERSPRARQVE